MAFDVDIGTKCDCFNDIIVDIPYPPRGGADNHRIVRKLFPFSDERTGADQAIFSDARAVEHDRTHAHQRIVADRASVQHNVMPNDASSTDRQWKARIGVQRRIVLDLRALAELDPFVVPAEHRTPPDTAIRFEPDPADQDGGFGDPPGFRVEDCATQRRSSS